MKENYQKQLDALLSSLPPEEKPRLLLQSCCGPCSSYVLEYLTRYFRVTVLYYNPNIQPRAEYDRQPLLAAGASFAASRRRSRWRCSRAIMTGSATSTPSAASSVSRRAAHAARYASVCVLRRRRGRHGRTGSTISARRSPSRRTRTRSGLNHHRRRAGAAIRRALAAVGLQKARGLQAQH